MNKSAHNNFLKTLKLMTCTTRIKQINWLKKVADSKSSLK